MDEQVLNLLDVDVIVARHPVHGFVIDGYVAPHAEELLRRLGYRRNEHTVLALTADLDEETARARHGRAAQLLAATRHAVTVLPDHAVTVLPDDDSGAPAGDPWDSIPPAAALGGFADEPPY